MDSTKVLFALYKKLGLVVGSFCFPNTHFLYQYTYSIYVFVSLSGWQLRTLRRTLGSRIQCIDDYSARSDFLEPWFEQSNGSFANLRLGRSATLGLSFQAPHGGRTKDTPLPT